MQAIAREFNFSETTVVLPPANPAHTARVRIFTPANELPFAGHPIIGTALALAHLGRGSDMVLELDIGPLLGVAEDPTAGSACATLGALLTARRGAPQHLTIHQGVEIGGPSRIDVSADGARITVAGQALRVMEGRLTTLPPGHFRGALPRDFPVASPRRRPTGRPGSGWNISAWDVAVSNSDPTIALVGARGRNIAPADNAGLPDSAPMS